MERRSRKSDVPPLRGGPLSPHLVAIWTLSRDFPYFYCKGYERRQQTPTGTSPSMNGALSCPCVPLSLLQRISCPTSARFPSTIRPNPSVKHLFVSRKPTNMSTLATHGTCTRLGRGHASRLTPPEVIRQHVSHRSN